MKMMMMILMKTPKVPFALSYFSWISLTVYDKTLLSSTFHAWRVSVFSFLKRVTQLLLFIVFPSSLSSMGRLVVKHCNCKRTFSFFPQGNWAFLSGTHGRVESSITFNVENKNKSNWELFFFLLQKWWNEKGRFQSRLLFPHQSFCFSLCLLLCFTANRLALFNNNIKKKKSLWRSTWCTWRGWALEGTVGPSVLCEVARSATP